MSIKEINPLNIKCYDPVLNQRRGHIVLDLFFIILLIPVSFKSMVLYATPAFIEFKVDLYIPTSGTLLGSMYSPGHFILPVLPWAI